MKFAKRDVVLWLRHLHEAGISVPLGCGAIFRLGEMDIVFEPMRPGPSGRATHGLRATGANRGFWTNIALGTTIDLELVRVLDRGAPAPADAAINPGMMRTGDARPVPRGSSGPLWRLFEALHLPSSRVPAFDVYIMIDWSAASAPKTGADSVWWCRCAWRDERLVTETIENPPTRQACLEMLRAQLRKLAAKGSSVLVGFDFPFGYPGGFARSLWLDGTPWRAVWNRLASLVSDDQLRRTNNRFEVASGLNRRIGASVGPFWGLPPDRHDAHLYPTEGPYPAGGLARLRETERHARGAQPSWKLWGRGSVGSQALLGIPVLARLRDDDELHGVAAVWPFETGCTLPLRRTAPRIVFAEIYPSLVRLPESRGDRVTDSVQVEAIARHFARHDAAGTLGDLFAAPGNLESGALQRVWTEEGWILGVVPLIAATDTPSTGSPGRAAPTGVAPLRPARSRPPVPSMPVGAHTELEEHVASGQRPEDRVTRLLDRLVAHLETGHPTICTYGAGIRMLLRYPRVTPAHVGKLLTLAVAGPTVTSSAFGRIRLDTFLVSSQSKRPGEGYWSTGMHAPDQWDEIFAAARVIE